MPKVVWVSLGVSFPLHSLNQPARTRFPAPDGDLVLVSALSLIGSFCSLRQSVVIGQSASGADPGVVRVVRSNPLNST